MINKSKLLGDLNFPIKLLKCNYCSPKRNTIESEKYRKLSHEAKISLYFNSSKHLSDIKSYIPANYLALRKRSVGEILYLIDSDIATKIAKHVLPSLKKSKLQMICETNPGFGLITSKLLSGGINFVRMYEPSSEFRSLIKSLNEAYSDKLEIFDRDIFQIGKLSFIDKRDRGNRVEQLLKHVPKREWNDDPVMTIIGTISKMNFVYYLFKALALQTEIVDNGRIRIIAIMRPSHYIKLTAGPELGLRTYIGLSILFNIFFNIKLIDVFPRRAFLPWESITIKRSIIARQFDLDSMYLVDINFKKSLPLTSEEILPFYFFIREFFRRPTSSIIPTVEKWIPNIGIDFLVPEIRYKHYFKDMNIYTTFGELNPKELLSLFKVMYKHPGYQASPFASMIESQLIKSETFETALYDEVISLNTKTDGVK